ncbi:MAG: hypothetical protein ACREBQ_12340, partial [Nitrososphaerales archaeon]
MRFLLGSDQDSPCTNRTREMVLRPSLARETTSLVSLMKALPFAAILVFAYFHDFPQWYFTLFAYPWFGTFVFALALSVFGFFSRSKVIDAYVELSNSNWPSGVLAFLTSIGLYIYGSYSSGSYAEWLQFESFLLLIVSYVLLSYDWRIVRLTVPLFLILGLVFPSPLLLDLIGIRFLVIATGFAMILLILLFERSNFRFMFGPIIAAAVVFVYFILPPTLGAALPYTIPLYFLVYAYGNLRKEPVASSLGLRCEKHRPSGDGFGFCALCGRKYSASDRLPRSGVAGLALIVLVLILLPLAQVPILQLSSASTPQYSVYTSGGATGNSLPQTPEGWLVNSSIPLNLRGDLYSVKNVYVPVSNPDRSNYT